MSATWIRVAAAAVSTVAIVASAPMIASATEGRAQTSDDQTSASVSTKGSNNTSKGDAGNRSSKDDKGPSSNARGDDHGSSNSDHNGEDGHHNGGGGNIGGGNPTSSAVAISVGVPAIAFTKDIVSSNGQLRAPVLINASQRAGTATLVRDGVPTSCSVKAQPGVVAWLQCALNQGSSADDSTSSSRSSSSAKAASAKVSAHTYSVVVKTTNGVTASHPVTIG